MKHNIHYTNAAQRDMDDIWNYIMSELWNVPAAERTINRILDTVDCLESFPEMGTPLPTDSDSAKDYRYLVSGSYMIFYRVCGEDVYVDRVMYGRRDYLHALFGDISKAEPEQ